MSVGRKKHTLDRVRRRYVILNKMAGLVCGTIGSVICWKQRAIDHAPDPFRSHITRLDGNDFDVPFRQEFLVKSLAKTLECCNRIQIKATFMKPRRRTGLARRVICKGGSRFESTDRGDIDDSARRRIVFTEVLDSLVL